MSNICTNPNCKDQGKQMEDLIDKKCHQCKTCKSKSCLITIKKPAYWYTCIECKEFGIYINDEKPKVCEYCGSKEVRV